MSRTEGVHLPRLPTSHARVTSSRAIRPHAAATSSMRAETRRRSLSEPSYTAYVGTPRQDIPHPVFRDAAMYDDVFDKEGRLLSGRNTAKFTSPLNTMGYNSLNDPHCQKLFLNNRRLRSHLVNLGLITDDLRVVATTKEQRQKIRAHELLERKEMLAQKLEEREQDRLRRLSQPFSLPRTYQDSMARQELHRQQWSKVQEMKTQKIIRQQEREKAERAKRLQEKKAELKLAMDEARLQEQAHRNALRAQQQIAEIRAYEKAYGKTAHWHREADKINNRMIAMKLEWARKKEKKMMSQTLPLLSHQTSHEETETHKSVPKPQETNGEERVSSTPQTEQEEKEREVTEKKKEKKSEKESEREMEDKEEDEEPKTGEEGKATHTQEEVKKDETPLKMEVTDESKSKGHPPTPPPQSPPPTPPELPVAKQPVLTVAEGNHAKQELTKILTDAFHSIEGEGGTGYISVEEFLQVLLSPDLGFHLESDEQSYIAAQIDPSGEGVTAYTETASLIPDLLLTIFSLRAQRSMQYYGYNVEEEWVQMYPVSGGVVYLNKLTGVLQSARPDEYRPFLKDEVFEDSLVDFFDTADTDNDGVIDYEDFYNLLASSQVASRIYRGQMEQLLSLYLSHTLETDGRMDLSSFPVVANPLLLMIYQNAYPDVEEWIELESKKFGAFWLNKSSGEIVLQQQGTEVSADSAQGRKKHKSKKKRKHRKKSVPEPEAEPHPLEPRPEKPHPPEPSSPTTPKSHPTTQQDSHWDNDPPTHDTTPSSTIDHTDTEPEPIKPVSSRSRLLIPAVFETIPEEDETTLSDSLVAPGTTSVGESEKERENERDRENGFDGVEGKEKREEAVKERETEAANEGEKHKETMTEYTVEEDKIYTETKTDNI